MIAVVICCLVVPPIWHICVLAGVLVNSMGVVLLGIS